MQRVVADLDEVAEGGVGLVGVRLVAVVAVERRHRLQVRRCTPGRWAASASRCRTSPGRRAGRRRGGRTPSRSPGVRAGPGGRAVRCRFRCARSCGQARGGDGEVDPGRERHQGRGGPAAAGGRGGRTVTQPWPIAMPSASVTVTQRVVWGLRAAVAARARHRAGSRVPRPCPSPGRSARPRRVASGKTRSVRVGGGPAGRAAGTAIAARGGAGPGSSPAAWRPGGSPPAGPPAAGAAAAAGPPGLPPSRPTVLGAAVARFAAVRAPPPPRAAVVRFGRRPVRRRPVRRRRVRRRRVRRRRGSRCRRAARSGRRTRRRGSRTRPRPGRRESGRR